MRSGAFLNPGRDLAGGVTLAKRAEELGYDSVWVTHGSGRDSFVVLAAYGAATSRIAVGNGVVPIYPRHPTVMAQAALTLNEMTGGRFRLGIGVSHRNSMEAMLGLSLTEPLAVMREYVEVLRGAFGSGVDFAGKHYRVKWSMAVPERPAARAAFKSELTRYLAQPFYRKMLEASGLGGAIGEFDRTGQTPDALADRLGAVGSADAACAYVAEYRNAGVTVPAVRPITFPDAPWYRRTLEAAAGA